VEELLPSAYGQQLSHYNSDLVPPQLRHSMSLESKVDGLSAGSYRSHILNLMIPSALISPESIRLMVKRVVYGLKAS
jgi:hypothetical protein